MASNRKSRSPVGCSFVVLISIIICVLLIVNGMLVRAFMSSNYGEADVRVVQAIQYVFPILMIFVEFWMFDILTTRYQQERDD